jgi:hypothetical protein
VESKIKRENISHSKDVYCEFKKEIVHEKKKYSIYEADLPDKISGVYYYMVRCKNIVVNVMLSDSEKDEVIKEALNKIRESGIKTPFLLKNQNALQVKKISLGA